MIGPYFDARALQINPAEARQKFMELIHEERRTLSPHAKQRALQRGFSDLQIYRCLELGNMVDGPFRNVRGNWEASFEGKVSGDSIRIGTALHLETLEYVVVITVVDIGNPG